MLMCVPRCSVPSTVSCSASTGTFRRALTASMNSCAEIECPFSDVTNSGRVWRKVPENDARSMVSTRTFRRELTGSVDSCAEMVSLQWRNLAEFGGRCRKAMFGVWCY